MSLQTIIDQNKDYINKCDAVAKYIYDMSIEKFADIYNELIKEHTQHDPQSDKTTPPSRELQQELSDKAKMAVNKWIYGKMHLWSQDDERLKNVGSDFVQHFMNKYAILVRFIAGFGLYESDISKQWFAWNISKQSDQQVTTIQELCHRYSKWVNFHLNHKYLVEREKWAYVDGHGIVPRLEIELLRSDNWRPPKTDELHRFIREQTDYVERELLGMFSSQKINEIIETLTERSQGDDSVEQFKNEFSYILNNNNTSQNK